jgi:hypothetical protein
MDFRVHGNFEVLARQSMFSILKMSFEVIHLYFSSILRGVPSCKRTNVAKYIV